MDKKIKLVFSPEIYKAAKAKADQEGQTLEDWLMAIVQQQLQSPEAIQALNWGRIDSRIDQRTIFLERRLDVLADRIDQLSRQLPAELSVSNALGDSQVNFCLGPEDSTSEGTAAPVTRLTA
jgi:hypothetical protein